MKSALDMGEGSGDKQSGQKKEPRTLIRSLQGYSDVEKKLRVSFYIFRVASLVLTSVVFMMTEIVGIQGEKIIIVGSLFIISHLFLALYLRSAENMKFIGFVALLETIFVALLLTVTGGMNSPFIWYALNPIIIASIYLQSFYGWVCLVIYLCVVAIEELYIGMRSASLLEFFDSNINLVFVLIIITLALQVLARVSGILSDQSQMLKQQQDELYGAFRSLSENHHMIQALSEYQREAVSCRDARDILSKLIAASEDSFPIDKALVLLLNQPAQPAVLSPKTSYNIIGIKGGEGFDEMAVSELTDRWQEFTTQKTIITRKKDWIAFPIWLERRMMLGTLMGRIRPGTNINIFPGNLSFFIYFTEQLLASLYNNKKTEETLQHMSSLYEAVETISSRDDIKEVIDLFATYARALTGCEKSIFWVDQMNIDETVGGDNNFIYTVKGQRRVFQERFWYQKLLEAWSQIKDDPQPREFLIDKPDSEVLGRLTCVPVKSRSRCFGILAVLQSVEVHSPEEIKQTLTFLANLAAVSIERNMAELFGDKMLLIEEQNRIANEIHDSVSQNLFSVVYGVDALIKQAGTLSLDVQKQLLSTIRDVTAQTSKELRLLIYRLSPRHRGDETFLKELRAYLNSLSELNQVSVEFNVEGKEEYMNAAMRRAFYRILKEATSNALRHGQCTEIKVNLEMSPFVSNLKVADNGIGFEPETFLGSHGQTGKLGLFNMRELAYSLKGNLEIESRSGEGTTVLSSVPTAPVA